MLYQAKKTSPIFHLPTDFLFGGIMADSIVLTLSEKLIKIKFHIKSQIQLCI